MRIGNIFKLLLLTASVIALSVIPAAGSTGNDGLCIEIGEYCVVGGITSATVTVNCGRTESSGIILMLELDPGSEFIGAENLHPEACLTAVCKNGRCVLMWDSERNTVYNGNIAKINICGGFGISRLNAWSDTGTVPIVFDKRIENIYEVSELCPELWRITQYRKYTPGEYIDTKSCDGCFLSAYGDGFITVGLKNHAVGDLPNIFISEYLSDIQ